MCSDFNTAANTHSASAIASTEKENFSFAHVRVKGVRTSTDCSSNCLPYQCLQQAKQYYKVNVIVFLIQYGINLL